MVNVKWLTKGKTLKDTEIDKLKKTLINKLKLF